MRLPPFSVIATWPSPNYTNPETRGPGLLIVELTVIIIALAALAVRLYVRIRIVQKCWWDDWLMCVGAFFSIGTTVSVILAVQLYGWNIHVWDLTTTQMIQGRQISIAGQTIFVMAAGFIKLSILTSYLRIAVKGSWFRRFTLFTIGVVILAIPGFLLLLWLQCMPASSYWNLFAPARDCIAEEPPLLGQVTVTVITDFMVYILPMPTLFKLKLPRAQKIGLMIVFGAGGVVVIAGCMRAWYIHVVTGETYDVTWEGFYLWIWTAVEANLGVICGCAPVLKPLIFRSSSGQRTGRSTTQSDSKWSRVSRRRHSISAALDLDPDQSYLHLDTVESGSKYGIKTHVSGPRPPPATFPGCQPFRVDDESEESLHLPREVPIDSPTSGPRRTVSLQRQNPKDWIDD